MFRAFTILVVSIACQTSLRAQEPILGSALYYPVLVTGCGTSASGFFWQRDSLLFFVTAAHVLINPDAKLSCQTIVLESYASPSGPRSENIFVIDLQVALKEGKLRRHPIQDVIVAHFAGILPSGLLRYPNFVSVKATADSGLVAVPTYMPFKSVALSNDVYLLGYPRAIGSADIPQLDYSQPLLRKGAVAGKNFKNNTIIIDCPSYPGNSGGPVLELDDKGDRLVFRIIGVLTSFVPFEEKWINVYFGYANRAVSNSGYSVVAPMDFVLETISSISK